MHFGAGLRHHFVQLIIRLLLIRRRHPAAKLGITHCCSTPAKCLRSLCHFLTSLIPARSREARRTALLAALAQASGIQNIILHFCDVQHVQSKKTRTRFKTQNSQVQKNRHVSPCLQNESRHRGRHSCLLVFNFPRTHNEKARGPENTRQKNQNQHNLTVDQQLNLASIQKTQNSQTNYKTQALFINTPQL